MVNKVKLLEFKVGEELQFSEMSLGIHQVEQLVWKLSSNRLEKENHENFRLLEDEE